MKMKNQFQKIEQKGRIDCNKRANSLRRSQANPGLPSWSKSQKVDFNFQKMSSKKYNVQAFIAHSQSNS